MRLALLLAAALVLCSAADGGAFPGRDGLIVLTRATPGRPPALVAVDPGTGSQRALGDGTQPAWSANGSRLAFMRDGTVYVGAPDGSGASAVGPGSYPAWSPDGRKLVVSRYDGKPQPGHPSGTLQLVVLDLIDGSTRELTAGTSDALLAAWSPDGRTIAFATQAGLATIPASGGKPTPLVLAGAEVAGGPSWAPNGRSLAFVDAGGQVWVAAADGAGAHQLTYTLAAADGAPGRPAWSPDGAAIAFTSGADLCVTDLGGSVRRVTRTPQSTVPVVASMPDWQPSATGSGTIATAPAAPNDTAGCDWSPGPRVEILPANVSPAIIAVAAPQQIVFVNHLTRPVRVTTTMHGASATIAPGRFAGLATAPGEFDFTVAGYQDGVPRRGSFVVSAAGRVTLDEHAAIRYGTRTVLAGDATGPAGGSVIVTAEAHGASHPLPVATVKPADGRWRLSVAPTMTTVYRVSFEGASDIRVLRVMPNLHVRRSGRTLLASLAPARRLAGKSLYVFRSAGRGWSQYRSARVGRTGATRFRDLPAGRYYVGFAGGDDYWGTATDPFTVR